MRTFKSILGFAGLLVMLTTANAQSFLTNGLVAYYPFDGDANDYSGYNNSSPSGSITYTTNRFRLASSAAVFTGANYLVYPDTSQLQVGSNLTVSCWIQTSYTPSYSGLCGIVTKGSVPNTNGWQLGIANSNLTGKVCGLIEEPPSTYAWGPPTIADMRWHHLCATINSATTTNMIYYDGIVVGVTTNTNASLNNTRPLLIGNERSFAVTGGNKFIGNIDDVRIYNRAFSFSEVAQLYGIESPQPTARLIKSVRPAFDKLQVGVTYQIQASFDLTNWYDQGLPFTATSTNMESFYYYDVEDWNQLFFRLQVQ